MERCRNTEEKCELVLRILSGDISRQDAARAFGIDAAQIEEWIRFYLASARGTVASMRRGRIERMILDRPIRAMVAAVAAMLVLFVGGWVFSENPEGCNDANPDNPDPQKTVCETL